MVLVRDFFLGFLRDLPANTAHFASRGHEQGNDEQAHKSELPVHPEQGSGCCNQHQQIACKIHNRPAEYALNSRNIACHPGDDLALLHRRIELQRHALKMAVHLIFHIIDDALRNVGIKVVLQHSQ
ncbi:hypothetical protein D3C71_1793250 [compost metagenome]